jgi:hypothetical protein
MLNSMELQDDQWRIDMEGSGRGQFEYYSKHTSGAEENDSKIGSLAETRNGLFRTQVRSVNPRANLLGMTTAKHDSTNVGVTLRPTSK